MDMSADVKELAAALAKAQASMPGAIRDSTNPFFKSHYADLESVWDACRKPLTDNGLSVLQSPSSESNGAGVRVSVETLLLHASGQYVRGVVSVSAKEDSPQAVGSCISYLKRYALQSFVGVAAIDDDGEAATARGNGHAVTAPAPRTPAIPPDTGRARDTEAAPVGERAAPPYGYVYIDSYQQADNGWHDVTVGRTKYSTKTAVGRIAGEAFEQGRPVRIDSKPKENSPGEHWLNAVTVWNSPAEAPPF